MATKPELEQQIILPKNWNNLSEEEQKTWIQEHYEEPSEEPYCFATTVEKSESVVTDKKGRVHKLYQIPVKSLLHVERVETKKEKNPDLVYLCSLNRDKIYYKKSTDEFLSIRVRPNPLPNNPQYMVVESYQKLDRHDFETMLALGILYQKDFNNPFPRQFYLRKGLKRKMRKILSRFSEWRSY